MRLPWMSELHSVYVETWRNSGLNQSSPAWDRHKTTRHTRKRHKMTTELVGLGARGASRVFKKSKGHLRYRCVHTMQLTHIASVSPALSKILWQSDTFLRNLCPGWTPGMWPKQPFEADSRQQQELSTLSIIALSLLSITQRVTSWH